MMMAWRRMGLVLTGAVVLTISTIMPVLARADTVIPAACPGGICEVRTQKLDDSDTSSTNNTRSRVGPSAKEIWLKQVTALRRYDRQIESYERCLATSSNTCKAPARNNVALPGNWVDLLSDPAPAAPALSPSQAGAIAVARLRLPLTPPKVGPDPKLNKWKMAAVGYPLWIWADGPTHVGPVSDSVGGLSVSLDAHLSKTVFRMGDGGTVTCTGAGTPYRNSIKPGTASPTCGYRYEKPSLPKGNYTVTAISYWAVTWTVNGTSGVITVPIAASAPLPVGEVQALVR